MQEIKSCQFCGSDDQKIVSFSSGANSPVAEYYIVCDNCGAQGPIDVNSELAILRWNSRIQEAPEMPQEKVQIVDLSDPLPDHYPVLKFCPFAPKLKSQDARGNVAMGLCEADACMMWICIGENKGRCGLVNTIYVTTGCGE